MYSFIGPTKEISEIVENQFLSVDLNLEKGKAIFYSALQARHIKKAKH